MDASDRTAIELAEQGLKIATGLSAEVASLQQRLAICEALLVSNGCLATGEIDAFTPSPDQAATFRQARIGLIERVFGTLRNWGTQL